MWAADADTDVDIDDGNGDDCECGGPHVSARVRVDGKQHHPALNDEETVTS